MSQYRKPPSKIFNRFKFNLSNAFGALEFDGEIPRYWQGIHLSSFAALTGKREDFFQAVSLRSEFLKAAAYNIRRLELPDIH